MEFTRLKITGFKSFTAPIELPIEKGLTGIVGPNGCGKSNLVEALRWVMGESSVRTLRAADADEIIFSGTAHKPARSFAEVVINIDNRARKAPASFNDEDQIEIIRRLDRGQGSTYRINGRIVRASDVRLIFADASSGARSPSLVAQGQIGELIAAKPTERRRIIEEAAGISGLYARRQDAERRLRRTEENLDIAENLTAEFEQDVATLTRQADQAIRFRALSTEIKDTEARIALNRWRMAGADILGLEAEFEILKTAHQTAGQAQTDAAKTQALMARDLPTLRNQEAELGARVQRLIHERDSLDNERRNTVKELEALERAIRDAEQDQAREKVSISDAKEILARLDTDIERLQHEQAEDQDLQGDHKRLETLSHHEASLKQKLFDQRNQVADYKAALKQGQAQTARLTEERQKLLVRMAEVKAECDKCAAQIQKSAEYEAAEQNLKSLDTQLLDLESMRDNRKQQILKSRDELERSREHLNASQKQLAGLKTEINVLQKLLEKAFAEGRGLTEHIEIIEGYEAALGAALGDDIKAPADHNADPGWRTVDRAAPWPELPEGVPTLASYVKGPEVLAPALSQIGVIDANAGDRLQKHLHYGQSLVSPAGDTWRWDGFFRSHKALSPLAQLLKEKNRLERLKQALDEEGNAEKKLGLITQQKMQDYQLAEQALDNLDADIKAKNTKHGQLKQTIQAFERASRDQTARLDQLTASQKLLNERLMAIDLELKDLDQTIIRAKDIPDSQQIAEVETALNQANEAIISLRSRLERLESERKSRQDLLSRHEKDKQRWIERHQQAEQQMTRLAERAKKAEAKRTNLTNKPDDFEAQKKRLQTLILEAEESRQLYVDKLNTGEDQMSEADRTAAAALTALGEAKASLSRHEEKLVAARERRQAAANFIHETFQQTPAQLLASLASDEAQTTNDHVEKIDQLAVRLDQLKLKRERMGGVNLLAEQELQEKQARLDTQKQAMTEIAETVKQLRQAIIQLNREGRTRLLEAFSRVNEHFKTLFNTLFPGGKAHLVLTESDDPLDAGLEIHACPPGKKLQNLALLSGGEQTLTALALIFAVFLTNPSPICVLDEADAPLDDINTLRYCELLEAMTNTTSTRFLVVTHNPLTMSRVDCLFGVTMAERGVSTLVSVDLREAELMVDKSA